MQKDDFSDITRAYTLSLFNKSNFTRTLNKIKKQLMITISNFDCRKNSQQDEIAIARKCVQNSRSYFLIERLRKTNKCHFEKTGKVLKSADSHNYTNTPKLILI